MGSHVGRIILTINGLPRATAKSVNPRTRTNRKAIIGMSPTGLPIGTVEGTPEFSIEAEFYIPKIGLDVDWDNLSGAVLTVSPRDGIGPTTLYTGVFCEEVGETYSENDAAVRRVTLGALAKVEV